MKILTMLLFFGFLQSASAMPIKYYTPPTPMIGESLVISN